MRPRFVVVPAVPTEKHSHQRGSFFDTKVAVTGFDLYDNVEKLRLTPTFNRRADAEAECSRRNQAGIG
ncbi:hypothetical protein J2W83_003334 [Pseudomonas hunanensis]|uniref:Uncharacterized protein n=1 Tax=Pseudomonas hunanensis TaxID=1247546 RepID=A0ACC6K5I8_9PSED|nr:hypothetical protein [Pseudomonas sp. BP8]MDR6713719.1 hypothetical protein [Pseudomonas hunanensis]